MQIKSGEVKATIIPSPSPQVRWLYLQNPFRFVAYVHFYVCARCVASQLAVRAATSKVNMPCNYFYSDVKISALSRQSLDR
jgi:hypothetical protein